MRSVQDIVNDKYTYTHRPDRIAELRAVIKQLEDLGESLHLADIDLIDDSLLKTAYLELWVLEEIENLSNQANH